MGIIMGKEGLTGNLYIFPDDDYMKEKEDKRDPSIDTNTTHA
jgi:hypothetical protein